MDNSDNILVNRAKEMYSLPREQWMTIDQLIYQMPDYERYDLDELERMRRIAIKESIQYHYDNSRFFNQFCKEYRFDPSNVKTEADYGKVPMLPDTFFKEYPSEDPRIVYDWLSKISTVPLNEYDYKGKDLQGFLKWAEQSSGGLINHSSGTTGNYGIMFRDKITFHRFCYAITNAALRRTVIHGDPHFVSPISPNTYLTVGRWSAQVSEVFSPEKKHFLTDREITMRISRLMATGEANSFKDKLILKALSKAMVKGENYLIDVLTDIDEKNEQAIVLSTPYQLFSMMSRMKDEGTFLDLGKKDSLVITGGGWKIFENKKIPFEEFAGMVKEVLGVSSGRYIDIYGMSEMNGIALSCEGPYKHLFPWIYPMVVNESHEALDYGEWGRFAFLDPAANSYPGYILTGDRVRLLERCPCCDRPGPVIDGDITRMQGAEAKGCANLMRSMMAEELDRLEKRHKK